jgi:hypothetical protein
VGFAVTATVGPFSRHGGTFQTRSSVHHHISNSGNDDARALQDEGGH